MWIEIRVIAEINLKTASKVFEINTLNTSIKSYRSDWTDVNNAFRANTTNTINKNINTAKVLVR